MQTDTSPTLTPGLLAAFRGAEGKPPLVLQALDLAEVPREPRDLLGQQDGMTAALERRWGETMTLRVRRTELHGSRLRRVVVLAGARRGQPAEIGFIEIRLDALPAGLAEDVRAARLPFGALLAAAGIAFRSRPHRFFSVAACDDLAGALQVPLRTLLYGRETRLTDAAGHLLAEAVEILAPIGD